MIFYILIGRLSVEMGTDFRVGENPKSVWAAMQVTGCQGALVKALNFGLELRIRALG